MQKNNIPVLEFDRGMDKLPVSVNALNAMAVPEAEGVHRHNYFMLYYVRSGSGQHLIDLDNFPLRGNTIYFVGPGQLHSFKPEQDVDGLAVSFTDEFFCISESNKTLLYDTNLFFAYNSKHPYQIQDNDVTEIDWLFKKIEQELHQADRFMPDMVRSLLKMIIVKASRENGKLYPEAPEQRTAQLVRGFLQLLELHFLTHRQVSDYAEMLVITPNHLNEQIKQLTGKSAGEHIRERVVLEAKRYAYYTDASLKETAQYLGFEDESHFSRYFKNETGQTYSEFRKNLAVIYNGRLNTGNGN